MKYFIKILNCAAGGSLSSQFANLGLSLLEFSGWQINAFKGLKGPLRHNKFPFELFGENT